MRIQRIYQIDKNAYRQGITRKPVYRTGIRIISGNKLGVGYGNIVYAFYRAFKNLRPLVSKAEMCEHFCHLPDKIQVKSLTGDITDEWSYVNTEVNIS